MTPALSNGKSAVGKGRYAIHDQAAQRIEVHRDDTEAALRHAIANDELRLHYQPELDLDSGRIVGFEALVRWADPNWGKVPSGEFLGIAEETGLIVQIGEWVVREACRAAVDWPDGLTVAVNISPKQFLAPGLSATILQALSQAGLPPQRLELEITESIFIADVEATLGTLHSLRDLGVRIALDDFGTGYSSLSYLRSFPFDKVKIDQSFVKDLNDKGSNANAVIRAITTLADALGMETLAEGVESSEQFDILRAEGCRYVQGYLVSKPMPIGEVNRLWADKEILGKLRAA